jgi:aspartate aminotransferase-like enzyme
MSYKLFIPGPIAVSEKTLRAMAQPMIGHRSTDFVALYQSLQPDLQALMATKRSRLPLDEQRLGRDGGLPAQCRAERRC